MVTGSIVALVTPMKSDGSVDWAALDALVDWHIEEGTHAIVPVGTTGESPTVTPQENCDIIRAVVVRVAGRVPVIAGTGANSCHRVTGSSAAEAAGSGVCDRGPFAGRERVRGITTQHTAQRTRRCRAGDGASLV